MGSHARYESLSSMQTPTRRQQTASGDLGTPSRPAPFMRQASIAGGVSQFPERRNVTPQRPGRVGNMVRMASEVLLIPARSASYYERDQGDKDSRRASKNYGTLAAETARLRDESAVADEEGDRDADGEEEYDEEPIWGHWKLLLLTIGLAGAQLSWSVELGYGTPYLLSLGLSKELTSLVWLAGPLSGFLVQPLVGALSDNSSSRYRRRRWVVYSTIAITLSALVLGFAHELAAWLVDLFNKGEGDWDPVRKSDIRLTSIGLAVAAFYVLDFSLNAIQAALRALVLDLVPSDQQTVANAYLARMTSIGNIVGYSFGYINLSSSRALHWIGGGQFRKLCVLAVAVLNVCVILTCVFNPEEKLPKKKRNKSLKALFGNIFNAAKDLPIPIRRLCFVQLFAWSGWFPVMFYSTTWVGVRLFLDNPNNPPSEDTATRAGSLSLLFQSIIAVLASILLPVFQALGASEWVLSQPANKGWNLFRMFLSWWTPRNIWTASHIFFVIVMASTFLVKTTQQATAVVALLGISWAITCWVPFAILMEFIREMEAGAELNADEVISASAITLRAEDEQSNADGQSLLSVPGGGRRKSRSSRRSSIRSNRSARSARARMGMTKALSENTPLNGDQDQEAQEQPQGVGGTILGIHNLAIVTPQFITACVAAIIFKISELVDENGLHQDRGIESGADVVWVLRFGGVMTLVAVVLSRYVPAPPSEQNYVADLKYASNVEDDQ